MTISVFGMLALVYRIKPLHLKFFLYSLQPQIIKDETYTLFYVRLNMLKHSTTCNCISYELYVFWD